MKRTKKQITAKQDRMEEDISGASPVCDQGGSYQSLTCWILHRSWWTYSVLYQVHTLSDLYKLTGECSKWCQKKKSFYQL